ncbi:MAG: methyltransferase domain-containing protein [Acidimicrobiales bacterium]
MLSDVKRLARRSVGKLRRELRRKIADSFSYRSLPLESAVRLTYEIMLGRRVDPEGERYFLTNLRSGGMTIDEVPYAIRASEEFQNFVRFPGKMLGFSIHAGRSQFIKSLPKASRIVDLGGTHLNNPDGAFVRLGYPYQFEELTVIDLPSEARHEFYKSSLRPDRVETERGTVRYQYHSMTDLSAFPDESVDLVFSGESFEHVSADDGRKVLGEAFRVLIPGGYIAIDTPNARVTRIQQQEFIDPDHKIEYTYPQLRDALRDAGFQIGSAKGLNLAQRSVETAVFDIDEVAGNCGMYDQVEDCYILCVIGRKPKTEPAPASPSLGTRL